VIAEHLGWRYVFVALAALFLISGAAVAIELRRRGSGPAPMSEANGTAVDRIRAMLRRPWVAVVLVSVFFEGMFFFGAFTFVGSYLWARFGLSFDIVGLIVAGFGVGGLIYAATAGRLVRDLGEGGLVAWGGLLVAVSFAAIAAAPLPLAVAPATIFAGFSYYMFHNTLQTHATQMAPDARGVAVATFSSALFLGQAAGVALAAPIFDHAGGGPVFLAGGILFALLALVFRLCLIRRS
jgi:predicted MFS family arabinose efflux permease